MLQINSIKCKKIGQIRKKNYKVLAIIGDKEDKN